MKAPPHLRRTVARQFESYNLAQREVDGRTLNFHRSRSWHPIGTVRSSLRDTTAAPKQGSEGAPSAWIELDPVFAPATCGLAVGDRLILLTWLHEAQRNLLQVHPRDDLSAPLKGVFATRSADRPNPVGLHPVVLLTIEGVRLQVSPLEAIDGTPVLDIKPSLPGLDALDFRQW